MSMSIDDLANSLSASHVGQEAIDLAALQAQLSQTLFSNPQNVTRKPSSSFTQPCNTPTFSSRPEHALIFDSDMEDERTVEDLLWSKQHHDYFTPSSSYNSSSFTTTDPFYIQASQQQQYTSATSSPFADLGKLPQQSPFSISPSSMTMSNATPASIDTPHPHPHPFFGIAAAAAFEHSKAVAA